MKYFSLISFFWAIGLQLHAQSGGFSEGKSLTALHAAVYGREPAKRFTAVKFEKKQFRPGDKNITSLHPIFLPRWSAEELPFFCKIEHDWGLKSHIPIKFRLGSVEYVDWLEGKD